MRIKTGCSKYQAIMPRLSSFNNRRAALLNRTWANDGGWETQSHIDIPAAYESGAVTCYCMWKSSGAGVDAKIRFRNVVTGHSAPWDDGLNNSTTSYLSAYLGLSVLGVS